MPAPEQAEWRWRAMAVDTVWVVAVGCAAEAEAEERGDAPHLLGGTTTGTRTLSCFRRGRLVILAARWQEKGLPAAVRRSRGRKVLTVPRIRQKPIPKRHDKKAYT